MSPSNLNQMGLIFYISSNFSQNPVQPRVQEAIVHPFGVQSMVASVLVCVYEVVVDVVVIQ